MDMWSKDCACLEVVKTIGSFMFEKRLCVMGCIASLSLNLLKSMIEKTVLCMLKEYGRLIRGSTMNPHNKWHSRSCTSCDLCRLQNMKLSSEYDILLLKRPSKLKKINFLISIPLCYDYWEFWIKNVLSPWCILAKLFHSSLNFERL